MIFMSMLILLFASIGSMLVLGAIINGYVLSVLWGWFFVPLFGLPVLSLAGAMGIALVTGYLTHQYSSSSDESSLDIAVGTLFVRPVLALLLGWIVQHWL